MEKIFSYGAEMLKCLLIHMYAVESKQGIYNEWKIFFFRRVPPFSAKLQVSERREPCCSVRTFLAFAPHVK
jgi:hypothetical protein